MKVTKMWMKKRIEKEKIPDLSERGMLESLTGEASKGYKKKKI